MNDAYYIKVRDNDAFLEVLEILFKQGHVFNSGRRIRTMEAYHKGYEQCWWDYIGVGCASDCKMRLIVTSYCPSGKTPVITYKEFIKDNRK